MGNAHSAIGHDPLESAASGATQSIVAAAAVVATSTPAPTSAAATAATTAPTGAAVSPPATNSSGAGDALDAKVRFWLDWFDPISSNLIPLSPLVEYFLRWIRPVLLPGPSFIYRYLFASVFCWGFLRLEFVIETLHPKYNLVTSL